MIYSQSARPGVWLAAAALWIAVPLPGMAQTARVSLGSGGIQANSNSLSPAISADGRWVAFASSAQNLVPNDTNDKEDVFVHDRHTGETTRVSVRSGGVQGNDDSFGPVISADGRWIAFVSAAGNLVDGDTNHLVDVFLHDRESGMTSRVSVGPDGTQGGLESRDPTISGDGRWVAFSSIATNLVVGDTN